MGTRCSHLTQDVFQKALPGDKRMKKTEGGVARGPTSAQVARALSSYSSHSCCCKAVMLDSFTQDGTCSPHLPQDSLHSREHTWEARGSSVPVQELIHQQDMAGGGEILQGLHILVLAVFLLPCNPNIKGQTVCVCGGVYISIFSLGQKPRNFFNI
jgi:hypothetical protein